MMYRFFPAWLAALTLVAAVWVSSASGQEKDARRALPSEAQTAEVSEQIREMYKAEYSKSATADRQALAAALLRQAWRTQDDPLARYVLLEEAQDVAASAGDAFIARTAIDAMAREYQIDRNQKAYDAISTATRAAKSTDAHKVIVDVGMELADRYIRSDDYQAALKVLGSIRSSAARSRDRQKTAQVTEKLGEVGEIRGAWNRTEAAREKLESDPDNAEAAQELGEFYALVKGDFDQGMPLLARGTSDQLKALATKEMAKVTKPDDMVALADAWWAYGEGENGLTGKHALDRARHWYRKALPHLRGFTRKRVLDKAGSAEAERYGPLLFEPGIAANSYNGRRFKKPVHQWVAGNVAWDWGPHAPPGTQADNFSVFLIGSLKVEDAGYYGLRLIGNRGSLQMMINDRIVASGGQSVQTSVYLYRGFNPIWIKYHHHHAEAKLILQWSPPGDKRMVNVPSDAFYHQPADEEAGPPAGSD